MEMSKTIPPKIGEFAYFDARLMKDFGINSPHWLVITENSKKRACQYSSKINKKYERFISNQGKIVSIKRQIGEFPKKRKILEDFEEVN